MAQILDTIIKILKEIKVCDHCLGRQFAMLGTGLDNGSRGLFLRTSALIEAHVLLKECKNLEEDQNVLDAKNLLLFRASIGDSHAIQLLEKLNIDFPDIESTRSSFDNNEIFEYPECSICKGLFTKVTLDAFIKEAKAVTRELQFETFLVGSRCNPLLLDYEAEIRMEYSLKWGETMKSHMNRAIGRLLFENQDKSVDFKSPDIVLIYNITSRSEYKIELVINPYFIYGRYRKLIRGIPQTHWPHRDCHGRGCEACNFTGKQYMESVEELIQEPVLKITEGTGMKFHGAGREDIDARMLGEGRPFTIEILNGKMRNIDYQKLQNAINEFANGKVEVLGLRESSKEEMQELKESSPNTRKKYRAKCQLEYPASTEDLNLIQEKLEGSIIDQKTPNRVLHRRADKIRKKKVYSLKWEYVKDEKNELLEDQIYLFIEAEGGTYIKELISSDGGRTVPSVTGIAGQQITCKELDVMAVSKKN